MIKLDIHCEWLGVNIKWNICWQSWKKCFDFNYIFMSNHIGLCGYCLFIHESVRVFGNTGVNIFINWMSKPLIFSSIKILIGVFHSFISSSLWPMISILISEDHLGTAYGTMQSIQNLGLAVTNIIIGHTIDGKGYFAALNIFLFFLISIYTIFLNTLFFQNPN